MYVIEKFENIFGIFFNENMLEGCCVSENCPCFGVFWASSDDVINRKVLVACFAYRSS